MGAAGFRDGALAPYRGRRGRRGTGAYGFSGGVRQCGGGNMRAAGFRDGALTPDRGRENGV